MKTILWTCLILLTLTSIAMGQTQPGLQVGVKAPDFIGVSYEGIDVQLSKLYREGPVILVFYRGGWCPYCTRHLKDIQSKLDDFKKYNATVIAVSVDKPQEGLKTVRGSNLDFDVISDQQTDILTTYNLIYKVPDELAKKYKEQYNIDLEAASGRTDHVIAIPATYIIDQSGTIVFSYANEDYKVRASPEEILQELQKFTQQSKITFTPIEHASFMIQTDSLSIHVDPVGELATFKNFTKPDILLITDTHHDHLDVEVVEYLRQENTKLIGPKAVVDKLGFGEILNNGEKKPFKTVNIEAIPMYNLTPDRLHFHEKGRGNGYIVTLNNKRIYISGDTEDIPEMRALKNIDYAFVCMNLPYTMSVEQAASAVLEFKPKVVFPYHYRGSDGMSDIEKFKKLVSEKSNIEVKFLDWY